MIGMNRKTMVLLVAHGSRREDSNEEVRLLAARMKAQQECGYTDVRAAFLELAEPSIPDGISQCVEAGAERVLVIPYFLSKGRHVAEDIPAEVAVGRGRHPFIEVVECDYLGGQMEIPQLLLNIGERYQDRVSGMIYDLTADS